MGFNPSLPTVMHIDINSCFATIEQQANPLLRGKPIAVAAYATPSAVILAPSIEAKEYGIKTGMRVREGKKLCPGLHVMEPDPNKYRHVHRELSSILAIYTNDFYPKSIDEFVLRFDGYPVLRKMSMFDIGKEIKEKIRKEVGDALSVSIGIGTSGFIAKTASNIRKPDGLEKIDAGNFLEVFSGMSLRDLHGINFRNQARLNRVGIYSVVDFYNSDLIWLKAAFRSISAYYWYVRLRGWEVDDVVFARRSFGNQYALPSSDGTTEELLPILQKLVEKTGSRLRNAGYKAQGAAVSLFFKDGSYWHTSRRLPKMLFDSRDIFREMVGILHDCPEIKPVRVLAESVFGLVDEGSLQLELFDDIERKKKLVDSIDQINDRWGNFSVTPARMVTATDKVPDRIAFGYTDSIDGGV